MKLKIDTDGHVVVQDGKPVYVKDDGSEVAFDAIGTGASITRLNGEAKGHRERAEAAETSLKGFAGIDDVEAALAALKTVSGLSAKQLIDAGKADEARAEAIKAVEAKYQPVVAERDALQSSLVKERIGGAFTRSQFITDKLAIPADMVEARFGSNFKIDGAAIVATDSNGNKIYSASNPGELAGFDEALGVLVQNYTYRDTILKGSGASGSGAPGGAGSGGSKTITRAQFDALGPTEKATAAKESTITD
jgi:hypothetical protein